MGLKTPDRIRTFQRKLYLNEVKSVGKPDAVAPQVRFDERGWETGPMCHRAHPRLYWFKDTTQIR